MTRDVLEYMFYFALGESDFAYVPCIDSVMGCVGIIQNNYMYYEYLDFAWRHHDAYLYESKDGILAKWSAHVWVEYILVSSSLDYINLTELWCNSSNSSLSCVRWDLSGSISNELVSCYFTIILSDISLLSKVEIWHVVSGT